MKRRPPKPGGRRHEGRGTDVPRNPWQPQVDGRRIGRPWLTGTAVPFLETVNDDHIPYTRLTHGELSGLRSGPPTPSSARGTWLLAGGIGLVASVFSLLAVQLATGGARLSYWGMRAAFHGFRSPPVNVIHAATSHGSGGGHGKGGGLAVIILVAVALVIFAFEILGAKLALCLAIGLGAMIFVARRLDAPMPQLADAQRRLFGPPRRRR